MIDENNIIEEMGEIAALGPDDSRRREFERLLPSQSPSTVHHWGRLLDENKSLRANLANLDVPKELEQRLLDQIETSPHSYTQARWMVVAAAAAVVLVMVGVSVFNRMATSERMRTVALLAINNHLEHMDDHSSSGSLIEKSQLETKLSAEVGFAVALPHLKGRLKLAGGRKCRLGEQVVALTSWRDLDEFYSVFQFRPEGFGLPSSLRPSLVDPIRSNDGAIVSSAWVWTEGPHGYVLTGPPGANLRKLSPMPPQTTDSVQ